MDQVRMLACHHTFCCECLQLQIDNALESDDCYMKLKCQACGEKCPGFIDVNVVRTSFKQYLKKYNERMNLHLLISRLEPDQKLL